MSSSPARILRHSKQFHGVFQVTHLATSQNLQILVSTSVTSCMVVLVKEAEAWVVVQEPYQLVDIRTVLENGLEKMKPFSLFGETDILLMCNFN